MNSANSRVTQTGDHSARLTVGVTVMLAVGVLPVFLLATVAVQVRSDLRFDEFRFGLCVSAFWTSAAVASVWCGRAVDRFGVSTALSAAACVAAASLVGISMSSTWALLTLFVGVGGVANTLSQIAANLLVLNGVPRQRRGLAFGVMQSSIPATTLVGGISVPTVVVTAGWRPLFAGAAVVAGVMAVQAKRLRASSATSSPPPDRRPSSSRASLACLSVAAGFGAAATAGMAPFIVQYASALGATAHDAGVVLATASAAAIGGRLAAGGLADRYCVNGFAVVAGMLAAGGALVALFPAAPVWPAAGYLIVLATWLGWGWPGLFQLCVVTANRMAPAGASARTQIGTAIGGVIGPAGFGVLVARFGYSVAWWVIACWLIAAALLTLAGGRLAVDGAGAAVTGMDLGSDAAT